VAVTGARVTVGDSQVVLVRELQKADKTWRLRDPAGQPLWRGPQTGERGFWTTKSQSLWPKWCFSRPSFVIEDQWLHPTA
jgi:hypothetical protein